jgi:hypothetical protein
MKGRCIAVSKKEPKQKSLPGCVAILRSGKGAPQYTCLSGVMTLEAVIVLPLLAGFFAAVLFFFRVMQTEVEVQKALDDTARRMAVYMADTEPEESGNLSAVVLGSIKAQFLTEMRDYDVAEKYIAGGKWGILFTDSTMTDREINLVASYVMQVPVKIPASEGLVITQTAVSRKWNGWKAGADQADSDKYVYVTEYGTVYHTKRSCKYLNPSITMAPYATVDTLQNNQNRKYRDCELCGDKAVVGGIVYITNEGECYHNDLACSGLKRTVEITRLSEVGELPACSKCSAGG